MHQACAFGCVPQWQRRSCSMPFPPAHASKRTEPPCRMSERRRCIPARRRASFFLIFFFLAVFRRFFASLLLLSPPNICACLQQVCMRCCVSNNCCSLCTIRVVLLSLLRLSLSLCPSFAPLTFGAGPPCFATARVFIHALCDSTLYPVDVLCQPRIIVLGVARYPCERCPHSGRCSRSSKLLSIFFLPTSSTAHRTAPNKKHVRSFATTNPWVVA